MEQGRDREFREECSKRWTGSYEPDGARKGQGVQSGMEQGRDREFRAGWSKNGAGVQSGVEQRRGREFRVG